MKIIQILETKKGKLLGLDQLGNVYILVTENGIKIWKDYVRHESKVKAN